jgi:hypothetical protein
VAEVGGTVKIMCEGYRVWLRKGVCRGWHGASLTSFSFPANDSYAMTSVVAMYRNSPICRGAEGGGEGRGGEGRGGKGGGGGEKSK